MREADRQARNAARLLQLFPTYALRIARIIAELEAAGFRPRIQDAWRSPKDQLIAFRSGHSKLKFGFHNVTGAQGGPEALAVDLLDDDHPAREGSEYLLHVAAAAQRHTCRTGIRWGLPPTLRAAVDRAVAHEDWKAPVKLGWDPCHIEPADLALAQAKAGERPA